MSFVLLVLLHVWLGGLCKSSVCSKTCLATMLPAVTHTASEPCTQSRLLFQSQGPVAFQNQGAMAYKERRTVMGTSLPGTSTPASGDMLSS
jgi:hypothetical protein